MSDELPDTAVDTAPERLVASNLACVPGAWELELDNGERRTVPVVLFRFVAAPDQPPVPEIALVVEESVMRRLRLAVGGAADEALKQARRHRRGARR